MNSAARALQVEQWFSGSRQIEWRTSHWLLLSLLISLVCSAMGVIYLKNMERHLVHQLQLAYQKREQWQVEWGQLLLERSTWATPSRIREKAILKLGMSYPNPTQIHVIALK